MSDEYSFTESVFMDVERIQKGYFRSLVSVSFHAFDPFTPPQEQPDPSKGTQYYYIGLKNRKSNDSLNSLEELRSGFVSVLIGCLSNEKKKDL